MKKLLIILVMFIVSGCQSDTTTSSYEVIDAEDVIEEEPNADILMYNDTIYKAGIDWVDNLALTKNEKIAKVNNQTKNYSEFENGNANNLSVGTDIYSSQEREDILIVDVDGEERYYYLIVEG
ncbi:hypothetical protein [Salinicoccus roseus]|uniref:hypothetical protein n=1 Tax=Salinicoccus roseus TaxID=45670 RepID=UPI003DA10300